MQPYKREFIEFMIDCQVLSFGEFTTKSGRKTPYFIDSGRYGTGRQLETLAGFYADAIQQNLENRFDVLFGPAYKGIVLAAATAIEFGQRGHDVGFCFNRKEAKDHGEGGSLVGAPLERGTRILIIEDVTTAGTSVRETVPLLRAAANVELVGLVVAVDRMERGTSKRSALAEVRSNFDMQTFAIVSIDEVLAHLRGRRVGNRVVLSEADYQRALEYRRLYAATDG